MKKTLIALLSMVGSVAHAETVIYDFNSGTGSNAPSYGTYKDITILQSGGYNDNGDMTAKSLTFNGSTVSITANAGSAQSRSMNTGTNENWDSAKLPSTIESLGLTDSTLKTLCSSSYATYGSSSDTTYPGIISVEFSGLAVGTYELSALSARTSGNMAPTTWVITMGGTAWTSKDYSSNAAYYVCDMSTKTWGNAIKGQPVISKSTTGAATYSTFTINVTQANTTLKLTLQGVNNTAASDNANKAIQFAALKVVPEPTTATLSLLALAGLAARRRRKN